VVEAADTLQARAEQEAAEALAKATAQAQALLEQSQREAARLAETARDEASAVTEAAHTEAERMAQLAEAARAETEQLAQAGHARAEQIAHPAPSDPEQLSTRGSGAAAPLAVHETPPAEPDVQVEPDRQGPESGATVSGDSTPAAEAAPREAEEQTNQAAPQAFTPPPVSVEDLATVSSLPRLGILSRLRDR
jgi:cell division septum initiation protein DivIVA